MAEYVSDDALSYGTNTTDGSEDEEAAEPQGEERADDEWWEQEEHGWLRWQLAHNTLPPRCAYRWRRDGRLYVPVFELQPWESDLDLYVRWRGFKRYFTDFPDLHIGLQVNPRGNFGMAYEYEGPYVTAEHRRALSNLILEAGGFEWYQMLTAVLPPLGRLRVSNLYSHPVAAYREPGLLLVYTSRLSDSRRPVRDPNPDATFLVNVSPTMRAAMHPFDTLDI